MAGRPLMVALVLVAGCAPTPHRAPPAMRMFEGLPVSGSLADARRAGFTACAERDPDGLRCVRHGVTLEGEGPYEAAVDLIGSDGGGGFDQLTLWHGQDQYAVVRITDALERRGWRHCSTGTDTKGDQMIFTSRDADVRISMDLSFWGKRRLRVIPGGNRAEPGC